MLMAISCRFCNTPLNQTVVNLGLSPLANAYRSERQVAEPETFYPLCVRVCEACYLVQVPQVETRDVIFDDDYAYFSSYSDAWLEHCKAYTSMIVDKLGLDASSHVVEVASNDGYLLQYFLEKGIPALGIEPATNVAETAIDAGIPTINDFFGVDTASQLTEEQRADLLIGNNVLAHVPDINDFVEGLRIALKPSGIITMEFPHLLHLLERREFDTIYHEHFSYFSLQTVAQIFEHHGVPVFDVEEIPTHGGSIRIYARHKENATWSPTARLQKLLEREVKSGITELATYTSFADEVKEVKRDVLDFLINAKRNGSSIVGYGAAAKGNTLFNYCGIGTDFIDYVVDRNPHKQGQYLPGTQIPVFAPQKIFETKPEYVIIVPWNLKDEIMKQMSAIQSWGGRFVTFIPGVEIHD